MEQSVFLFHILVADVETFPKHRLQTCHKNFPGYGIRNLQYRRH